MKKVFWVAVGIGLGALAYHKFQEARSSATTAEGLNRTVGRIADSIEDTLAAFREGMAAKEAELLDALGLDQRAAQPSSYRGRHAGTPHS